MTTGCGPAAACWFHMSIDIVLAEKVKRISDHR